MTIDQLCPSRFVSKIVLRLENRNLPGTEARGRRGTLMLYFSESFFVADDFFLKQNNLNAQVFK